MPEGRIGTPVSRRKVPLTSLIDMLFVLLFFFILTTTFVRESEIELLAAGAGEGVAVAQVQPVFLRLGAEDLVVNTETVELEALLAVLAAYEEDNPLVLVSLREDVGAQRLVDLLTVLRNSSLRVQVLG